MAYFNDLERDIACHRQFSNGQSHLAKKRRLKLFFSKSSFCSLKILQRHNVRNHGVPGSQFLNGDRTAMSIEFETQQQLNQVFDEVRGLQNEPAIACITLLESLRTLFDASAPGTLFFANSLNPVWPTPFRLYSHHHVGDFPPNLKAVWDRHLVRADSPLLRAIRAKIDHPTAVGKTHAYLRNEIVTDIEWMKSNIFTRLAYGVGVHDQLLGWHHQENYVIALILRSKKPRRFDWRDKLLFHHVLQSLVNCPLISGIIHPRRFPPRLTPRQEEIRNMLLAGLNNKQIARLTLTSQDTADEQVAKIKKAYAVDDRLEITAEFLLRGGNPKDIEYFRSHYKSQLKSLV